MRPLSAEDEAALRAIAERHGYFAARGPHTGEGSASRLIDALLTGEVVTCKRQFRSVTKSRFTVLQIGRAGQGG